MKDDKYKHKDVDICIVCDEAYPTAKGNGVRPFVCGKCFKKIKIKHSRWNKTGGVYLTKVEQARVLYE